MPSGFFAESTLINTDKGSLESASVMLPKCGACGLFKTCRSPKMPVYGRGKKGVLIIGDMPGKSDDISGQPFTGESGRLLREHLSDIGIDLYSDCWSTYALICRPPKGHKFKAEVQHCRPNIIRVVNELRPKLIILLGQFAVRSLIGFTWKEDVSGIDRWVGYQIPDQTTNAWICPAHSPTTIVKGEDDMLEAMWRMHISSAFDLLDKRPWDVVPDYSKAIRVIEDEDLAVKKILRYAREERPVAADYETNGLKPEYEGFEILCCSLSTMGSGKAIAFPWTRKTRKAMKRFWLSDTPKIASNLKYEDRVTRHEYGGLVIRNWYWDTMIAAHVLDCRPEVTSIKFQSYVYLGVREYNAAIEPFLKAPKHKHLNTAKENIDPSQLMQYCGEDSLYEGLVAEKQIGKEM